MKKNNYLQTNKQSPYEILDNNYAKWIRLNFDSIQVATQGYCGENCMVLEDELKRVGVFATKRRYNQASGETYTVYKLKGSFK